LEGRRLEIPLLKEERDIWILYTVKAIFRSVLSFHPRIKNAEL